jgi:hypothetical protein
MAIEITDPDHPLHHIFLMDLEAVLEESMRLLSGILLAPGMDELLDDDQ